MCIPVVLMVSMGHAGEKMWREGKEISEVADGDEERGAWFQGPVRRQRSGLDLCRNNNFINMGKTRGSRSRTIDGTLQGE